jgi:hypothetical protein
MTAAATGSWARRAALGGSSGGGDATAANQETANDALALIQAKQAEALGGGTWTDRSTTQTVGGTSRAIIAAASTPRLVYIANPDTETETLYLNYGAAANTSGASSIPLFPGGSDQRLTAQSVNVNCATTGHKIVAKESN